MSQPNALISHHKRQFSLSMRVSVLLMLAALLPLLIFVASSELLTRPTLIAQADRAMETDAQTRVQLIDTYFTERLLDAETLSQVPSLQAFLASPVGSADLTTHAIYGLAAGQFRDSNYTTWSLFDTKGQLRLFYPTTTPPKPHGQYLIPPGNLKVVTSGKTLISAVYFDPATQKASVDICAPIITSAQHTFLGIIRSTLNIDYIWNIVNSDRGANGNGSYAFILDQNSVRIADTEPSRRFSAVAPLSPQVQQEIHNETRYGTADTVPVLADSTLAAMQHTPYTLATFSMTPAGQSDTFQATRRTSSVVPWVYFVLSPTNTVTAVANQQLLTTSLVALMALLLAALLGLGVGRRITRPILRSVENLRSNSQALNTLATKQQSAASEQTWVVDSSQVGLKSVQYYTDATTIAAHRLSEISMQLAQCWDQLDVQTAKQALEQVITIARYIEKAAHLQNNSNQKLATALKVTTQVNEQLAAGATSATDAATQLEQVVNQLRQVVGK